MLKNAYFLAKNGADTAENEQHFAEILPTSKTNWQQSRLAALEALEAAGGSGSAAGRVALPEQVPEGNVCGAIGKCWPTRCSSFT